MNFRQLCLRCLELGAVVALSATMLAAKTPICPRSPENPTVLLALLGMAGVSWQYLRGRKRR